VVVAWELRCAYGQAPSRHPRPTVPQLVRLPGAGPGSLRASWVRAASPVSSVHTPVLVERLKQLRATWPPSPGTDAPSAWSVMTGIVVRQWHTGLDRPRHHDGDVIVEYRALGDAVPSAAAGPRFDDHLSYCTMVFDHRNDLADEDERRAAFAFMSADLTRLVREVPTLAGLKAAVADGLFRGFIRRQLREVQP
jgi:hypothetical protein